MADNLKLNTDMIWRRIKNTLPRFIFLAIFFNFISSLLLNAQNDIIIQDIIIGKAEVSVPVSGSITLKPGFHAKEGSNFHAYIGKSQEQNSSIAIGSINGSETPAEGSENVNYVKSVTYREAQSSLPTGSFKHSEEIQYFDGLGRPVQAIQVGASPEGNDIIQPVIYDSYGREAIKTLPYTDKKGGDFRTRVTESTVNAYYSSETLAGREKDGRAFTLTEYDNSPLNRVAKVIGPGTAWETKPVTIKYLYNTFTVIGWNITGDYTYNSFPYPERTLYITETVDEQGNSSREYKDKLGQVVQKEVLLGNDWLRTAYIYDDFGLLRCVVPPEASSPDDNDLCFYYLYDARKRMVEKKIPGGGTVKMVYDKRDRLRFTQNSNQATVKEWSFTKYDELNRPVITGILNNYSSGASALDTLTNSMSLSESRSVSNATGYDNSSFPNTSNSSVYTITYYDDYDFFKISDNPVGDNLKSELYDKGDYNIQSKLATGNKGRITGSMTVVLSDETDASSVKKRKLYSASYYDNYGNLLRTISDNHMGGTDVLTNLYEDITFLILRSKQEHYNGPEKITIEKWFEYDHTGRLLATREKINDQPEITVSAMTYNEVGEMITKYLHSDQTSGTRSFVQKTDYRYNIRGWLTKINDPSLGDENDIFGMQLFYNSTAGLGGLSSGEGLYNGNIAGMKWGIKGDMIRGYRFTYDNLNRLLKSEYAEGSSLGSNTGYYSENINGYDKNGNIKGLERKHNNVLVDKLTYTYFERANRLQRITDSGTVSIDVEDYPGSSLDYGYDTNGNMSYDGAKNLSVKYYSTLNLPQELDFGSNNRIFYHYSAGGAKLAKHTIPAAGTGTLTHYIGNVVYEGSTLSYILTDEGRLIADGTGADRKFLYEYNLKDHLGNTRVTFMGTSLGGAVDVVQTTSYYPFGLVMSQTNGNTSPGYRKNKYLYNGKELQDDLFAGSSLNWFDYRYRFYDPQIARFNSIDRLADKYPYKTPYDYAENRPIDGFDLDGLEWTPAAMAGAYHPVEAANSLKKMEVDPKSQAQGRIMFAASLSIAGGAATVYGGAALIATASTNLSTLGGAFSMSVGISKTINGIRSVGATVQGQPENVPKYNTYMGSIFEDITSNSTVSIYADLATDLSTSLLNAPTSPVWDAIGKVDLASTGIQTLTQVSSDINQIFNSTAGTANKTTKGETVSSEVKQHNTTMESKTNIHSQDYINIYLEGHMINTKNR